MSQPISKTRILVGRGVDPQGDFAFASTNRHGAPGQLSDYVANSIGADLPDPRWLSDQLSDGFAIIETPGRPTLVLVVSIDRSGVTGRTLLQNLHNVLSVLLPDIRDRRIWFPLMGTGAGRLAPLESLRITVDSLAMSGVLEKGQPREIVISAPPNASDTLLAQMSEYSREVLGDVVVEDQTRQPDPEAPVGRKKAGQAGVENIARSNLRERVPFYPDHPAFVDALGRDAIAETIVDIVNNIWAGGGAAEAEAGALVNEAGAASVDRTFMVHLHGRWGSGKTSVLNFLRMRLCKEKELGRSSSEVLKKCPVVRSWLVRMKEKGILHAFKRADADQPAWVVVDYNAWRNQGHGPAWWTLLNRVHTQATEQLGGWATLNGLRLNLKDWFWRIRSGWAPYLIVVGVIIVLVVIWSLTKEIELKDSFAVIGSVIALAAGVFAFGRTYRIGSARTAATMLELTRDPLRPLTRRYYELINEIGCPVAVFIDDLDRCDAAFVVELLQSIQTLYRRAPVLYVVAADRDWICCSYEQIYEEFKTPISEPGRPLGHLFLEKIFQLSVTLPSLSPSTRYEFWDDLLEGTISSPPPETAEIEREEAENIAQLKTEAELRAYLQNLQGDSLRRRLAGAQAFRQMQAAPLQEEREHLLRPYAAFVEPNPRSMKRLINAYGFKRGFEFLAGPLPGGSVATVSQDVLIRWTIIELRWPALAAHLAKKPEDLGNIDGVPISERGEIGSLLADDEVKRILEPLTPNSIHQLVGSANTEIVSEPTAA